MVLPVASFSALLDHSMVAAPGLRDEEINETSALGPGQELREGFSGTGPVTLRHEGREPVLAPHFVLLVAGESSEIGIGADDPARGIEDQHDGLRRLNQALGEVAFLRKVSAARTRSAMPCLTTESVSEPMMSETTTKTSVEAMPLGSNENAP